MNINRENWKIEDTMNFIKNYLNVYKKIRIKNDNNLLCLEEDFDTLDFNGVSYLINNEKEIDEYIINQIKNFEKILKKLYEANEIQGYSNKYNTSFLLAYEGEIYNISIDLKGFYYSKIKKKYLKKENNYCIFSFDYIKSLVENKNIEAPQKVKTIQK